MSESANLMPFVCKLLGTHSNPQHFETEEKLRNHIIQHDINSCKRSISGDLIYICSWKGCYKYQSSIIELKEHLLQYTQQKPFKCPICNRLRFCSPDALSQHLIMNHKESVVDFDTDDENEKLNLGKVKDKNDVCEKKEVSKDEKSEIIPIINTKKLSYRDVLVKGRVNENKNTENEHEKVVVDLSYQDVLIKGRIMWDLIDKGFEIISLLPESPISEYNYDNDDNLPIAPRGEKKLTEIEADEFTLKAICRFYKDSEAGEYFTKALEMMEDKS
ncbi:14587_t:CDS:2 [Funneliformis caledonium]|uniref:14587_t:CDS:1 n=1 Tax=Funneliformis caledonium TaxID=1117310 RepID=A0A9N9DZL3_9GLOM|nr:14587_t:CDS:2 [Funneliformis caledonium]